MAAPKLSWADKVASNVPKFRKLLLSQDLPLYRSVDGDEVRWYKSPGGTDMSLLRFLAARKGDYTAAMKMFIEHLSWRRRIFPIPREGRIAELLDEGVRFRLIGCDGEGVPILLINFLFGNFIADGQSEADACLATIRFFEETIASMEPLGVHKFACIAFGCPPPVPWARVMVSFFQNNYPERLKMAIVYPVSAQFVSFVRSLLWFFDENTRTKIDVESEEQRLRSRLAFREDDLPEELRGTCEYVYDRWKADGRKLLRAASSFMLPHTKQIAELEQQLFCRVKAPRKRKSVEKPPVWVAWMPSCCTQRSHQRAGEEVQVIEQQQPVESVEYQEVTKTDLGSCVSLASTAIRFLAIALLLCLLHQTLSGGHNAAAHRGRDL